MAIGRVEQIDDSRKGTGARGPWTLYKVKVDGSWYSFGFKAPAFIVGDRIQFDSRPAKKGNGQDLVNAAVIDSAGGGTGSGGTGGSGAAPPWDNAPLSADTRQMSIVMQHSQEMAIDLVGILLAHNALPITKGTNKSDDAKRFAEINAAVDKLTVRLYNDALTCRQLKFVADTVPSVKVEKALPAGKKPDAADELDYVVGEEAPE